MKRLFAGKEVLVISKGGHTRTAYLLGYAVSGVGMVFKVSSPLGNKQVGVLIYYDDDTQLKEPDGSKLDLTGSILIPECENEKRKLEGGWS